jgi:hypothetical protein
MYLCGCVEGDMAHGCWSSHVMLAFLEIFCNFLFCVIFSSRFSIRIFWQAAPQAVKSRENFVFFVLTIFCFSLKIEFLMVVKNWGCKSDSWEIQALFRREIFDSQIIFCLSNVEENERKAEEEFWLDMTMMMKELIKKIRMFILNLHQKYCHIFQILI